MTPAPTPLSWRMTVLLGRGRWQRNFVLPRYAPRGWSECDLFEMTPAGFFREYEVKISRGDFFADAKKAHYNGREGERNKHARLAAGDPKGPRQFWFVTPVGLITPEELPSWAGWIEIANIESRWPQEHLRVRAPFLHKEAADPQVIRNARTTCYWRLGHRLWVSGSQPDEPTEPKHEPDPEPDTGAGGDPDFVED